VSEQLGWLDTNVFVHSLYPGDPHCDRCRQILRKIRDGIAEAWIDPLVIHELTYVFLRRRLVASREDIYDYLFNQLTWDGLHAVDKPGLLETLARWSRQNVSFVDAWLAVQAQRRGLPVCSVNERDFSGVDNTYSSN
jgi:predicted nucleic acid-binding protein